jgi:hypothetical protein
MNEVQRLDRAGRAWKSESSVTTIAPRSLPEFRIVSSVATLAGFGWIAKCGLLVSRQFGSAIRLN